VNRWSGTVHVDAERLEASTVEVVVDATSLEVREGTGGAVPLLAINRSEIVRTIHKVLKTKQHPDIIFRSTAVEVTADGFRVHGELTITDVTRAITLTVSTEPTEGRPRGGIAAEVVQSDFGIKPYSAMFGALKVRDMVELHADVQL
jgi:polyisoprenoid-binding protein YceI